MANVKNDTVVCALNVNCLSQDGAINKNILVHGGFPRDYVKGLVDMDLESKNVHTTLPRVSYQDGKLVHEANCKGQEKVVGKVSATAGIPPKFLNASHKSSKVISSHGFNGNGMGICKQ